MRFIGRFPLTCAIFTLATLLCLPVSARGNGEKPAAPASAPGYPLSLKDALGNAVTLAGKPRNVVSLTLPTDEILLSLLEKGRLAAVTTYAVDPNVSNVASQAAGIPNKLSMNVEKVISLEPDLVFAADWSKAEDVKQLRQAGLAVYQLKSPHDVAEIRNLIRSVAEAVGEERKGAELVQWMDGRLESVSRRLEAVPQDKRLSVMDYNTWGTSMGHGSSWDEIVRLAGLRNAVADLKVDEWGQVALSKEKLLQLEPDLLFLPGWVYGDEAGSEKFMKQILSDPALKDMRCVRGGKVFRMSESLKTCTSQYIVNAVEELARIAYPDALR